MRGGIGRVRERWYKILTEGAPMPEPHGNGHGNGHDVGQLTETDGHAGQAAGATPVTRGEPHPGEDQH
jgi:hypothetical protein